MNTTEQAGARTCRYCGAPLGDEASRGVCLRCALGNALEAEAAADTVPLPAGAENRGSLGIDQIIGRYKLLEKIGEGGCGVVYVAEQTEPVRRRVALKVIKLGMDTKAVVARFEAERQALAMMDHPNIAKVLDAGTTDAGGPYFVMELVRGIKITDYCDENNLPTKERLGLFIKVCQAIQHAHQKGIIHRDIKPSNILVTLHDGVPVPKVIDFGIAKATEGKLTDATVYTQLHQFIGTPAYMSPEQAEMSGLDIDTRSDIYSLGVLLYELLVGSTPFDARELMSQGIDAMRRTIREQEPMRPSTKLATLQGEELTTTAKRRSAEMPKLIHLLRGDLDWIVMKCLEKDRSRRYETANGLAMDLERHLNNEAVFARPPSAAYRFQKAFRRNKLAFSAAAAVAAALVIGITISTWQSQVARKAQRETELARNGERQQRLEAEQKQAEAEAQRQRAQTEQHRADAQARKASESQEQSRQLLYASDMNLAQQALKLNNLGNARRLLERHRPQPGEEDLRGWEWRYLWQLTRNSALVTLTNQPTPGFSLSFSPDGHRLAVGWFNGRVELWDVPGHKLVRAVLAGNYPHQGRVAFSPVRNLLAATAEPKTIALYDLDSGQESTLWHAPDSGAYVVRDLSFSQDGSKVVIYAGFPSTVSTTTNASLGDSVWVVEVPSGAIQFQQKAGYSSTFHFGGARLAPDNRRLYLARGDSLNYRYSIQCVEVATGQELWQTQPQRDFGLTTLAVSPDGRVLASGSGFEDPKIRIWDAASGRLLFQLQGHTAWVSHLGFSKDGRELISAATDQTIRTWDARTWTEGKVLRGHSDEVYFAAISEPGQLLASTGKDGNLMLWNEDEKIAIDGYLRLPDNLRVDEVLPLNDSRLLLLPLGQPPQWTDLKRASSPGSLPLGGTSADVLGFFGTNILCCWDGTNQIVIREVRGDTFAQLGALALDCKTRPSGFTFHSAHQVMAWTEAPSSASVFLASLAAPGRRIELRSEVVGLLPICFSPDAKYLLAGAKQPNDLSAWATLRAWNVESGQIVASVDGVIRDARFAAGGRVLALAVTQLNDHEIRFCDLAHPEQLPRGVPGTGESFSLAVSPDGGLLAGSTSKGEVRLFDSAKGELIESVHGHLQGVFALAFSPDGRRLISASGGREAVKIWDVSTRQEMLTLSGTGSLFLGAKWSADGDTILAGAPWQAWRAPSWQEIAAAEGKEKQEVQRR